MSAIFIKICHTVRFYLDLFCALRPLETRNEIYYYQRGVMKMVLHFFNANWGLGNRNSSRKAILEEFVLHYFDDARSYRVLID